MADKIGVNGVEKSVPKEKLDTSQIQPTSSSNFTSPKSIPSDIKSKQFSNKNPSKNNSSEGFKSIDYQNVNAGKKQRKGVSERLTDASKKLDTWSDDIYNSNLPQFAKNRIHDRLKNSSGRVSKLNNDLINKGTKIKSTFEKVQKVAKTVGSFIARFWWLILAIIVIVFGLIPLIIAIAMQIGNSPHFYCNLDAPAPIRSSTVYQQYCGGYSGGNEDIAQAAVSLAYDLSDINAQPNTYVASKCASGVSHAVTGKAGSYPNDIATQLYVDVHDAVDIDSYYASCDRGTCTAVRWAGADDDFPLGPCPTIIAYLEKHTEKWEKVGVMGEDITKANYEEKLVPGDIMICEGHIGIYVGEEAVKARFPNSSCLTYAASLGDHCPQLQGLDHWLAGHSSSGENYTVYRNTNPEEGSKYKDLQF